MSKTGHGTYKKFLFETCAAHFIKILCALYGKAHGIMQINQNKYNFPVSAANIEIFWCFGHKLGTNLYLFQF